jgi:stage II sporulation protein P
MATNLEFAKRIKAYMDKHKPGLIKGIFIGRGSYNQDLSPRAMLLEVGTHTNNRYRAEKGADVFADALPAVLNIKTAAQPGGGPGITTPFSSSPGEGRSIWSSIGWIIGVVLIGGAIFLFISTGSLKGMRSKVGELRKTEFANIFGLKKASRKNIKNTSKNTSNKEYAQKRDDTQNKE